MLQQINNVRPAAHLFSLYSLISTVTECLTQAVFGRRDYFGYTVQQVQSTMAGKTEVGTILAATVAGV